MIEVFNIRTLAFLTAVTAMTMFLCMLHVAMRRKTYPGFYLWAAAALVNGIGLVMISFRHWLPDFGSVVLANSLIGLSSIFICRGLASFNKLRQRNWLDATAMTVLVVLFALFTHWQPDVRARVVVISLFIGLYFLRGAWIAIGPTTRLVGEINYLLASSLLFIGAWFVLRGVINWFWGERIEDFMSAGVWHGLTFLALLVCNILVMVGLISLNSKRTENDLVSAKEEIKSLRDFLPICANCKKIRDDQGYWQQVESYISQQTGAEFTHGICPDCMKKLYPEFIDKI